MSNIIVIDPPRSRLSDWVGEITTIEDLHWQMCFAAAARHNLTPSQAEECDNGSHNCVDCPFKQQP